ncbi:MAG: adenine deaminase [Lachnospiraceae bacterium]|nr:adenine deaminase [Lachnospiraceae bacterium]
MASRLSQSNDELYVENLAKRRHRILVASGKESADLVLKNARYLNVFTNDFREGDIAICEGFFAGIGEYSGREEIDLKGKTVVPGFMDGHLHLESSIISPRQYARTVLPHGTTAIFADPHEIANVLGETGIDYILDSTAGMPLEIFITLSSCVPATCFDEAGADLTYRQLSNYIQEERVRGLAEMMNYPGIVNADEAVIRKLQVTMKAYKRVDGHAPGLTGKELNAYVTAGISSDHECSTFEEALEKLSLGQWIMIREGTACHNLEKLMPLLKGQYFSRCLLVTDDKHSSDLVDQGHIDHIIRKAISLGAKPEHIFKVASFNAAEYFGLNYRGAISPGYQADFVILDDVNTVDIHSVYKKGVKVAEQGILTPEIDEILSQEDPHVREFYGNEVRKSVHIGTITEDKLQPKNGKAKLIGLVPHEILTTDEGWAESVDVDKDIVKLAVVERHKATGHVGVAYLKGYGLKNGAVATTIAHDSHNLIVAGTNDTDILTAINRLQDIQGGMVVVENGAVKAEMALPIAGLMCDLTTEEVREKMTELKAAATALGTSKDIDPFMTLSFVSLPVIPQLRLTTLGVVDVDSFSLVES